MNHIALPPLLRITIYDKSCGLSVACPVDLSLACVRAVAQQPPTIEALLQATDTLYPTAMQTILLQIIAHDRQELLWRHASSPRPTYTNPNDAWVITTLEGYHAAQEPSPLGLLWIHLTNYHLHYQLPSPGSITYTTLVIGTGQLGQQYYIPWTLSKLWTITGTAY